jgi:hypothetical protein
MGTFLGGFLIFRNSGVLVVGVGSGCVVDASATVLI